MNEKKSFSTLKRIIKKTNEELESQVIIRKNGGYQAYKEYSIIQNGLFWEVTTEFFDEVKQFNLAKSALSWCIAYKAGRYELANLIKVLDTRLAAKQTDIDILTERLKYPVDEDIQLTMQCRLSEDIHSRQSYKRQLANCVNSTKYIKIKGSFNNELRRFTKAS